MKYKAIFWDHDGTLVDTEGLFLTSCLETAKYFGTQVDRDEFVYDYMKGLNTTRTFFEKYGINAESAPDFYQYRDNLYQSKIRAGVALRPGIKTVLDHLKDTIPMGIVTSSPSWHFDVIMEVTGLLPYFDFVIKGDEVGKNKPHPEGYLKAAAWLALDPKECLVIEDNERGLQAAKAAGCDCIVIPHHMGEGDYDYGAADKVLESAEGLRDFLY